MIVVVCNLKKSFTNIRVLYKSKILIKLNYYDTVYLKLVSKLSAANTKAFYIV